MKPIYTIVRYYRKPLPSANWCPRYCAVYKGYELIEERLDSQSIKYVFKNKRKMVRIKEYKYASNIASDLKAEMKIDWDQILDLSEVELTTKAFKYYQDIFKLRWKRDNDDN